MEERWSLNKAPAPRWVYQSTVAFTRVHMFLFVGREERDGEKMNSWQMDEASELQLMTDGREQKTETTWPLSEASDQTEERLIVA